MFANNLVQKLTFRCAVCIIILLWKAHGSDFVRKIENRCVRVGVCSFSAVSQTRQETFLRMASHASLWDWTKAHFTFIHVQKKKHKKKRRKESFWERKQKVISKWTFNVSVTCTRRVDAPARTFGGLGALREVHGVVVLVVFPVSPPWRKRTRAVRKSVRAENYGE